MFSYIVEKGSVIFKSSRFFFDWFLSSILTNYTVKYLGKIFNRSTNDIVGIINKVFVKQYTRY